VGGDRNALAGLGLAHKAAQTIPQLTDARGYHEGNIATCGYILQARCPQSPSVIARHDEVVGGEGRPPAGYRDGRVDRRWKQLTREFRRAHDRRAEREKQYNQKK
jgi:hypothetical protein